MVMLSGISLVFFSLFFFFLRLLIRVLKSLNSLPSDHCPKTHVLIFNSVSRILFQFLVYSYFHRHLSCLIALSYGLVLFFPMLKLFCLLMIPYRELSCFRVFYLLMRAYDIIIRTIVLNFEASLELADFGQIILDHSLVQTKEDLH